MAQSAPDLGEKAVTQSMAITQASQFSQDTGGIGIVLGYGTDNDMSAEAIGHAFVQEIRNRGLASRYYFYITNEAGTTIAYHTMESTVGPLEAHAAAAQMSLAVRLAELEVSMAQRYELLKEEYGDDVIGGMADKYLSEEEKARLESNRQNN